MRKINIIVLAALLLSLLLPITPVYAEVPSYELDQGDKIILDSGDEAIYLGQTADGHRFRAILGAPKYIPGTTTEIKPNWYYDHNVTSWVADTNLFDSVIVKDCKVTVEHEGQKMTWEPTVLVGTKDTKAIDQVATLLDQDPMNENYFGNTLEWIYPDCKRHLRIIEGVLQEFFIFDEDPGADVQIVSNLVKDPNFVWDRPPFAYDAEGIPIEISANKIVLASEFAREDVTYPITIDPTSTFASPSSDGVIYSPDDSTYATVRDASSGVYTTSATSTITLGQGKDGSDYFILRTYVFFDTSGLPDDAEVDSAVLKLYGNQDLSDTNFDITIQSGMPTYPHDPLVLGDYDRTHYSGDGGTFATVGFVTTGYNSITLSATGEGWINLEGDTKFVLRSSRDINGYTPSGDEAVRFYTYEQGNGYWPLLEVTYTATSVPTVTTQAVSDISTTTGKPRGYMDNDGGEACRVMFEYDVDSGAPYAFNTSWLATNYTTGQSFDETIVGLNVSTTYYVRAVANNTEGQAYGSEVTFDTLASLNPPTNLLVIPRSSTEISATFTKGEGAFQTLARYKIGSYPSSTSDGTLAYNGTKGSFTLEDLTPGTTYWFKFWGYDSGNFSASNVTEMATTFAGMVEGDSPFSAPGELPNFWGPPSYIGLSNLPMYDNFNARADDIGMDRGNFWLMIFWMIAIVFGAGAFMMTKNPTWGMIGVSIGVVWGWQAGPIPGIWMLVYAISALIIIYTLNKGGAYA